MRVEDRSLSQKRRGALALAVTLCLAGPAWASLPPPAPTGAPVVRYNSGPKLCTEAVTICAKPMHPLGVPVGGSFTVRIENHFSATYECLLQDGQPRWVSSGQQGSCAPQPVIYLPAKYDDDEPWNIG